ncbi:MAG: hypothetical protein KJ905_02790 [Nanoarchaeota archaeon]|nr:hypothetical protein [Nanoarchaeota archaeon]MBU1501676.1 hypothetical protein [Nanoarchaeota archaeon]
MKLVVDANILFALANPSSSASSLVSALTLKLFSPDFALEEIGKYKKEISEKSGVEFKSVVKFFRENIIFVNASEYSSLMNNLSREISDTKDLPYLALAVKLNLSIWSNDKHFKEQKLIPVFTTAELVELIS